MEYFLSGDSSTLENYDALFEEMRIGVLPQFPLLRLRLSRICPC
jgi:hypothetical protein